jgi:hypothetical protein
MNKVIKFKHPTIENAYLFVSGRKNEDISNGVTPNITFFYADGDIGAEWEPQYGPITIITKCEKDHFKDEPEDSYQEVKEHWYYEYCTGFGNWSQLAVQEEGLHTALIAGNDEMIFSILKKWATNDR